MRWRDCRRLPQLATSDTIGRVTRFNRKRSERDCSLCGMSKSSRRGEHVLPRWFVSSVYGTGPWTVLRNGQRMKTASGRPRSPDTTYPWPRLPCCLTCNGRLNTRFEEPSAEEVKQVVSGSSALTQEQANAAGLWLLKTLLLYSHPETEHPLDLERTWRHAPQQLYRWMLSASEPPPPDLGLWVHRFASSSRPRGSLFDLWLPEVHADGEVYQCRAATVGLGNIGVTLLYHPGWNFEHPLESEQAVARLWPGPSAVDLAALPALQDWPLSYAPGWQLDFEDGAFDRANPLTLPMAIDTTSLPGVVGGSSPASS